jgi:hypothetical protein
MKQQVRGIHPNHNLRQGTWLPLRTSTDKGSETIPETGTAFDNTNNLLKFDSCADLHGDESQSGTMGIGALGGGDEFYGVE